MKPIDEFVSNAEIIERLKDILSPKLVNRKVLDRDVADFIGIHHLTLASQKNRNSPTFSRIILKMCARTGLDPMKLLF